MPWHQRPVVVRVWISDYIPQLYMDAITCLGTLLYPLQWRHDERDALSNHQHHDCLLKRLSRCISKKTSKLRVTVLREGNSPVTGEFPAQRASNVSIWLRHPVYPDIIKQILICVNMVAVIRGLKIYIAHVAMHYFQSTIPTFPVQVYHTPNMSRLFRFS